MKFSRALGITLGLGVNIKLGVKWEETYKALRLFGR